MTPQTKYAGKILVLGPAGTFSHEAAETLFPKANIDFAPSFDALFETLEKDNYLGFVPIENSLHGSVDEVLDLLVETSLKIWQTHDVRISYAFGCQKKNNVQSIASHQQALAQCRKYLKDHFPDAERFPVSSTTYAIDLALADPTMGAVASRKAMEEQGLPVIADNIEPQKNTTRFAVIAKKDPFPQEEKKEMGLVFHPVKDKSGLLHDILVPFKIYDINLTKIENRPTGKGIGDYHFFINFLGNTKNARIKQALKEFEAIPEIEIVKELGEW